VFDVYVSTHSETQKFHSKKIHKTEKKMEKYRVKKRQIKIKIKKRKKQLNGKNGGCAGKELLFKKKSTLEMFVCLCFLYLNLKKNNFL
jgi:hypothetical protein